ncbi:hypothetical protein HRbin27_01888 [bacterium HR27]|nr:hypothetical protein HRbin27_01888 [bacterium HR27]
MSGCAGPCSREFSCTFVGCLRKVCAGNLRAYVLLQVGRLWPTGAAGVFMLDVWRIRVHATLPFREAVVREFLAPGPRATGLLVACPGVLDVLLSPRRTTCPRDRRRTAEPGVTNVAAVPSRGFRPESGMVVGSRSRGPAGGAAVGGLRVFSRLGDARDAFRPAGCGASVGRRVRTVRRLADASCGRMARPAGRSGGDSDRIRSVASSRVVELLASVRCGLRSLCSSRAEAR